MDWFAVSTVGTWPGTGHSGTQIAAYAVSYGLLGVVPDFSIIMAGYQRGLHGVGLGLTMR